MYVCHIAIVTSSQISSSSLRSACSERSASCSIEGGASNSSLGGQSTATLGGGAGAGRESLSHDYPSLSISDDFPADMLLQDYEVASIYGKF